MVQLMDYEYYRKYISGGNFIASPDQLAYRYSSRLAELPHQDCIQKVIETIEGAEDIKTSLQPKTQTLNLDIKGKFSSLYVAPTDLSTSCKTAINIIYLASSIANEANVVEYVSLNECGSLALEVCLYLLEEFHNIVGVLSNELYIYHSTDCLPFTVRFYHGEKGNYMETNDWYDITDYFIERLKINED